MITFSLDFDVEAGLANSANMPTFRRETGYTLANEAVDNATWRTPIWSVNAGSVTNQSDRCVLYYNTL